MFTETETKYDTTRRLSPQEIAAQVRADLAAAQIVGELPDTVVFTVRDRGGGADVMIRGCADAWLYADGDIDRGHSQAANELRTQVETICQACQSGGVSVTFADESAELVDASQRHRERAAAATRALTQAGRLSITYPNANGVRTVRLDDQEIGTLTHTHARSRNGACWRSWVAYRPDGTGYVRDAASSAVYYLLPKAKSLASIAPTHPSPLDGLGTRAR